MKSLMMKDLINIRGLILPYSFLLIMYVFVSFMAKSQILFCALTMLVCVMLVLTTCAFDDRTKWNIYALSMPITRKDLIIQKYALGVSLMAIVFIISILMSFIFPSTFKYTSFGSMFLTLLSVMSICIILLGSILPFIFKLSSEKWIFIILLLIVVYGLIFAVLANQFGRYILVGETIQPFMYILPLVSIMALFASLAASMRIFEKKDF